MNNLSTVLPQLLLRHYRLYAAIAASCFLVAFGLLYYTAAPQWQVSGLVRIGQTPALDEENQVTNGLLMSIDASIALIRQEAGNLTEDGAAPESNWKLRVRPTADNLLEVKVQAPSIEKASELYAVLIKRLKLLQDGIYSTRNEFWKEQGTRLSAEIATERELLEFQTRACNAFEDNSSEKGLLCANLLANESARLDQKTRYQSKIEEALLPVWSYPTDTLGSLNQRDQPVSPKLLTSAALSFFIALIVPTLLLVMSSIWILLNRDSRPPR